MQILRRYPSTSTERKIMKSPSKQYVFCVKGLLLLILEINNSKIKIVRFKLDLKNLDLD